MFRVATVLLLLGLWAMPARAQTSQPPQGRTPPVHPARQSPQPDASRQDRHKWWIGAQAKELGLTNDQSQKLEGIYQQVFPRIQTGMQDVEAAQRELDRIVAGDKTTEVEVVRQLNLVQAARNEVSRQYVLMMFRMNRELTPDQRAKATALRDRMREQERREGRRGEPPQRPPIKK